MVAVHLLGIDLGTGSAKAAVVGADLAVLGLGVARHPVDHPGPGAAESDPGRWLASTAAAVRDALAAADVPGVDAIGLSGQMHGVVCADGAGTPLRPATLWPDTRAAAMCDRYARLPDAARHALGNPIVPGMFGPLLAHALERDPDLTGLLRWALSPKDWLRLALTDEAATEPSDASATLLWDVRADDWSHEAIEALELSDAWLPPVMASAAVAGRLAASGARLLGLPVGTPVAAGAGDTAAAMLGTDLDLGDVQLSVGTGAQVVVPIDAPHPAATPTTHRYRRAEAAGWYAMAAMQNAGLALDWVRGVLRADVGELHAAMDDAPPGAQGVTFHPYLTGERTPLLDLDARGTWLGLSAGHGRAALLRAALEGVAFAIRDGVDALTAEGVSIDAIRVVGGGVADHRWRRLLATVLARPLYVHRQGHVSVLGATRLAARAIGDDLTPTADRATALETPSATDRDAIAAARIRWLARRDHIVAWGNDGA